jgi:hypothetical protein
MLSQTSEGNGVFGGSISFDLERNSEADKAIWTIIRNKNPKTLSYSVGEDTLVLAFAPGPNIGKPLKSNLLIRPNPPNQVAYDYLQRLINQGTK